MLLVGFFFILMSLLNKALNLDDLSTRPGRKTFAEFYGSVLLWVVGVVVFTSPIAGYVSAYLVQLILMLIDSSLSARPGILWNSQMKNSCSGYPTRVRMDKC